MPNTAPTFTVGYGTLITDFAGKGDTGYSLAVQADGKFVLAGRSDNGSNYDIAVARYNADGSLDTSFSSDGRLTTPIGAGDDSAQSVAIQADGKVVVAGYSYNGSNNDFAVVRYNIDGSLDASFSGDGKLTKAIGSGYDMASGVRILADGRILVAGTTQNGDNYDFAQVRYNADGSLDTGGTLTAVSSPGNYTGEHVAVLAEGKILVAGFSYNGSNNDFALTRYNADGSLDAGFGTGGKVTTAVGLRDDVGRGVALQADGRILVAGSTWVPTNPDDFYFNTDFALVRYNADGSLDSTFSSGGIATVNVRSVRAGDDAFSVRVLDDGKILVAGTSDRGFPADFALARFNADGSLDTAFGAAYSLGGAVAFTTLGAAVVLDSSVAFADAELDARNGGAGDYAGATITLARHGGSRSDDVFDFAPSGAAFYVAGNSLLAGGQAFGTWSQSGGTLSIALTSSATTATHALVDNVLEHITYRNTSFAPPASVQIDWTLTDSQIVAGTPPPGLADMPRSVTGSTTVTITAISHANTAPDFSSLPPGIVTTSVGTGRDEAHGIALQADGRLLVVGHSYTGGNSDFALVRYNADGSLDAGFSGDGKLATAIGASHDYAYCIAVQADGKVLVAGKAYIGATGVVLNSAGGSGADWSSALVRYNPDGSLDTTFSGDGKLTTTFGSNNTVGQSLAVQADGKILLAGYSGSTHSNFALLRYNADGSLDASFDADGGVTTDIGISGNDYGNAVAIQADGRIVIAGSSNGDFALARYHSNGSLDTSFSDDGKLSTAIGIGDDQGYALVLQTDGRILVAGSSNNGTDDDFALVRYNADGSLDTSFGGDGLVTTAIGSAHDLANSIALQADGKIVLAGYSWNGSDYDMALARYNVDGSLDTSFSGDGVLTTDVSAVSDYGYGIVVQPDGKILVAGQSYKRSSPYSDSDFAVIRYNSDGSLDSSFEAMPTGNAVPRHVKGGPPVVLDSSMAVSDYELDLLNAGAGDYTGASVTVSRHGGGSTDDVFGFATAGAGFTVSGNALQYGGQTFGNYSQSGGTLVIAFTSDTATATRALMLDVLEHITYVNTGSAPPASLQIDWRFSDGNIGAQGTGPALATTDSTTVSIAAFNNAPTVANAIADRATAEDVAFSFVVPAGTFADIDAGDSLTWTATRTDGSALPGWLSFNSGSRVFSGTPADADVGVLNLRVTARDGGNASVSEDFALTVTNVNDTPSGTVGIDGTAMQAQTLTATPTVSDADGLGAISYQWKANGTPISGATASTFLLGQAQVGKAITVTASYTDGHGTAEAITSNATAIVANINDAPITGNHGNRSAGLNQSLAINLGMLFSDADGDTLTFGATGLPDGLSMNTASGLITGTTPSATGVHHITIAGTDPGSASVSLDFDLDIIVGHIVSTSVATRSGQVLPGVTAHEVISTTSASSLFGFKNVMVDTTASTGIKTLTADLVVDGTATSALLNYKLTASGSASFQIYQAAMPESAANGWTIQINPTAANRYAFYAQNDGGGSLAQETTVGQARLTLPGTAASTATLSVTESATGESAAPDRSFRYSKFDLGNSGQFSDTLPDSNVVLAMERGTSDLIVAGKKPITAADALDALKLSVGLTAATGSSWKEFIAADMNHDGRVTAADALEILKTSVGINTIQPAWVFVPNDAAGLTGMTKTTVTYKDDWNLSSITAPTANTFTGILVGDVNNSWVIPA